MTLLPFLLIATAAAAPPDCPALGPAADPVHLHDLVTRFEEEPGVTDVHRWVVRAAQLQPARAEALVRDARARGALPLVRVRGRYDDRSNRKWTAEERPPAEDHDSDWTLDLWLEWDLAELAAGPDLSRAVREGRAMTELRQAVLAESTVVYFDRRRVLTEDALDPCPDAASRAERRLRRQELDATLDALTAGRWNEALSTLLSPPAREDAPHERVDRPGEDPDPGLRVSVHPADRPSDP